MGEWIEINVGLADDVSLRERTLLDFVKPFVEKRAALQAWHFLWENNPWPLDRGAGITLRLRLMGEKAAIEEEREIIDGVFRELHETAPDKYLDHCFGSHGLCGEDYLGETETWGTRGWRLGIKLMQVGSEIALELIANRQSLGTSDEFRGDAVFYADRWNHLFMDQIHTLLAAVGVDEGRFFLREAMTRLPLPLKVREPVLGLLRQLDEGLVRGRNVATERPVDFSQGLLDLACRMHTGVTSIGHEDPNLCVMAAVSGLSAAWVGCIGRSKNLAPPEERPELTTEVRKKMSAFFDESVPLYLIQLYRLGLQLAPALREARGQQNYQVGELPPG